MKQNLIRSLFVILAIHRALMASQFSSGSTGVDGALIVTNNTTLSLPPNGIFNFTTITVTNSATLKFTRNALNTPVYLLATGDVTIYGTIDVSANGNIGGPGGFDGGMRSVAGLTPGDGHGPGAGSVRHNYNGVFEKAFGSNTNIYGNTLLMPLIGGSGGAGVGEFWGGGGGGAIAIASTTRIDFTSGTINADGGLLYGNNATGGGGSGGGIRLVAPIVSGTGSFSASGNVNGGGAAPNRGRIRIDCEDGIAWTGLRLPFDNQGKSTRGSHMIVFPANASRLDIIQAAGSAIPEGTSNVVSVSLPIGAPTNQLVRVQARGFTNDVPIRVIVVPDSGPSAVFDGLIQLSSGNPAFADVEVTLVTDTVCHIHAWTR